MENTKFTQLEVGQIALIQQRQDGRIVQIGLTKEQSDMLQVFLSGISADKPLFAMPEQYDLMLKVNLNNINNGN